MLPGNLDALLVEMLAEELLPVLAKRKVAPLREFFAADAHHRSRFSSSQASNIKMIQRRSVQS